MSYEPTVGDRVRVTRWEPGNRIKFVKTGTITELINGGTGVRGGYFFDEDDTAASPHSLAGCDSIASMPGWSQRIEPL